MDYKSQSSVSSPGPLSPASPSPSPREPFPERARERDDWILARRGARATLDPWRPHGTLIEMERTVSGAIEPVGTVFLTNRECPWRCVMCDLWRNTLTTEVPPGAIPAQIEFAIAEWERQGLLPRTIKLYNSGSFFDPHAIPPADHERIATLVGCFARVVVESHPALVNERALALRDRLGAQLEVAMGLETVHPDVLPRLNKRMTLDQFRRAAEFLRRHNIDLRSFVLLQPPFLDPTTSVEWALRSTDFAFDCGAGVVAIIPTRAGNGALDDLVAQGDFAPPTLEALEQTITTALARQRGRVLADLWDLEKFARCAACLPSRRERLHRMNLSQTTEPPVVCPACGAGAQSEQSTASASS